MLCDFEFDWQSLVPNRIAGFLGWKSPIISDDTSQGCYFVFEILTNITTVTWFVKKGYGSLSWSLITPELCCWGPFGTSSLFPFLHEFKSFAVGLGKWSGVDVYMAKLASLMVEMLLLWVFWTEIMACWSRFHVLGLKCLVLGFKYPESTQNILGLATQPFNNSTILLFILAHW